MPSRPANVSLIHRRCPGPSAAPGREQTHQPEPDHLTLCSMSVVWPATFAESLARDHAAPASTLALVKATSLACGRSRPLAWCSRPRNRATLPAKPLVRTADHELDVAVAARTASVRRAVLTGLALRIVERQLPRDRGQLGDAVCREKTAACAGLPAPRARGTSVIDDGREQRERAVPVVADLDQA